MKRYLWLIDTLKRGGEMTYEEISDKWNVSSVNDAGVELSKRTFYNHCKAVERHFGIEIECRRGRGLNLYRISNPEAIEENSLIKWAIDSFSLGELLMGNSAIADRILLEEIPSGREWLEPVLQALRQNLKLRIEYESFVGTRFNSAVKPLCVKLFKRRWYVVVMIGETMTRVLALDRIKNISVTNETFSYPKNFFAAEYFSDVFGIFAGVKRTSEKIVIRAYEELPNYLRSLPIHHSQRELDTADGHTDFALQLVPTFDFMQELLSHRNQLEVIAPRGLRDEMAMLISKMNKIYNI